MTGLLKDRFNYTSLYRLAVELQTVYEHFPIEEFVHTILDDTWNNLTFKHRIRRISLTLGKYLPKDYQSAIHIIDTVISNYDICLDGLPLFFLDFIELYGQDQAHWDISMAALARYTQYATAEFAVRAFILRDEKRMMTQMAAWAKHNNEHVRRLASEGCRPKLPWGQALPSLQQDPSPILNILEQLKADPSAYVRKSVANNLNDISKTHPDLVVQVAQDWYGKDPRTNWIIKHGCRTLLKQANKAILSLLGFSETQCIQITDFALESASIFMGQTLNFSFNVSTKATAKVRLEYGIDYVKANGKRNRKLFQISEFILKAHEQKVYTKNHPLMDTSTRKHYPGIHSLTLMVNGTEQGTLDFTVLPTSIPDQQKM